MAVPYHMVPGTGLHSSAIGTTCVLTFIFYSSKLTLFALQEQLELCQKSLSAYLETKRGEFPRFYFVSDPTLLEILSLGSHPPSVVPHFQSGLFDSLADVAFDETDTSKMTHMFSPQRESVEFDVHVDTKGNIEVRVSLSVPALCAHLCAWLGDYSALLALAVSCNLFQGRAASRQCTAYRQVLLDVFASFNMHLEVQRWQSSCCLLACIFNIALHTYTSGLQWASMISPLAALLKLLAAVASAHARVCLLFRCGCSVWWTE